MSSRASASKIIMILLGCLTAIIGFFAFNLVDGVFGFVESLVGLAACIATTVFVYRRSAPAGEDTNV